MKKLSNSQLSYYTLRSLGLPHGRVGQRLRVGFADDGTYVEVEFWDADELVGSLRWECGASDEPIRRRFKRLYVRICQVIPPYCARDVRLLYRVVCEILQ